jgi:hypothetical protein
MPDLKSELSKVITSWNDEMPTSTPTITQANGRKITTNSTRMTFNYVRDNPGVTRMDAALALAKEGVNMSSSTSLLSVMVTRGNLRRADDGGLFATQKEYEPLPKPKKVKARNFGIGKVAPTPAPKPVPAPEPTQHMTTALYTTPSEWTVESVIGGLNVRQALAVYDELRKIFGG